MIRITISRFKKLVRHIMLALISIFAITAYSDQKIDIKNWINNPEILEIRKLSKEIDRKIKTRELVVLARRYKTEPYTPSGQRCNAVSDEIVLNKYGRVKRDTFSYMQRHILITTQYIFDEKNVLRFIYATQDGDDAYSFRAYFRKDGSEIIALTKDAGIAYKIKDIKNNMFLQKISEKQALESYRNAPSGCSNK